mgnify:FL=1
MSHNPDKLFMSAFALPIAAAILANSVILLVLVRSSPITSGDSFTSAYKWDMVYLNCIETWISIEEAYQPYSTQLRWVSSHVSNDLRCPGIVTHDCQYWCNNYNRFLSLLIKYFHPLLQGRKLIHNGAHHLNSRNCVGSTEKVDVSQFMIHLPWQSSKQNTPTVK